MAIAEREPALERLPWTSVLHDWVTTVDHKKIGIMYFLMAVVFLVIGGAEALVMRFQLLWPESKAVSAGCLQSDDDDARHHDDLLRGHADPGRSRQLHRAAADRGARHGLSAAECPGPVGDAVRGHPGLFQLCHRRSAGHWLVCLRSADRTHLLARRRRPTSGSLASW